VHYSQDMLDDIFKTEREASTPFKQKKLKKKKPTEKENKTKDSIQHTQFL